MNCRNLKELPPGEVYIMGNQSADLDSCVTALSLSTLITAVKPEVVCIPLIQGDRDDLKLKPEIGSLLERSTIDPSRLIFISRMESTFLTGKNIILVDHNHPEEDEYDYTVIGIVDHHRDSGFGTACNLRDIRICGSCGSIVSEYWQNCGVDLPYAQRLLLAGVIEVDTGGLNEGWGKTTGLDREQYLRLLDGLKAEDRDYLKTLLSVKNDLSHLGMDEHLRRDFKNFPLTFLQGGISSVTIPISEFFRDGFFNPGEVDAFCRVRCPGFLLIMHSMGEPLQRELSLYSSNEETEALMIRALQALDTEYRGCRFFGGQKWHRFRLKNSKISRKVLVPLLLDELV